MFNINGKEMGIKKVYYFTPHVYYKEVEMQPN